MLDPIDQSSSSSEEDERRRQANASALKEQQDTSTVGEQDEGGTRKGVFHSGVIGAIAHPDEVKTGIMGAINQARGGVHDTSMSLATPKGFDTSGGGTGGSSGGGASSGGGSGGEGQAVMSMKHGGPVRHTGLYKLHKGEHVLTSHMAERFRKASR
jgi:hypothetical protein